MITAFLIGFGVAQLVHGPLADRFGRKPVLGIALAAYVVTNVVAAFSGSFVLLLVARVRRRDGDRRGARVVTVALVRDCYSGPGDGAGDEPRLHRLHGRADHRAEPSGWRCCSSATGG